MGEKIIEFSDQLTAKDKVRGMRVVAGGMRHVRSELLDDWVKNSLANITSPYGLDVYSASLRIMQALSRGKTPEEAYRAVNLDLFSGIEASMVEVTAIHFHPRGLELKDYLDPNHTRFDASFGNPNRADLTPVNQ